MPDTKGLVAYWLGKPTVDASAAYRKQAGALAKMDLRGKAPLCLALLIGVGVDACEREGVR